MRAGSRFTSAIHGHRVPTKAPVTRRTEGVRKHGRSARVVADVLRSTAEEIGRVGYAALRIEDVAERSGVNKTSIYRRWPTKVDLVTAAIWHFTEAPDPPDTGSVREDLLHLVRYSAARASTPVGRGIMRMLQLERAEPDVERVSRELAKVHLAPRRAVIEQAIRRGELPAGTNVELVIELVFAPVIKRIAFTRAHDDAFLEAVVDVVVAGAKSGAAARKQAAPSAARRRRT